MIHGWQTQQSRALKDVEAPRIQKRGREHVQRSNTFTLGVVNRRHNPLRTIDHIDREVHAARPRGIVVPLCSGRRVGKCGTPSARARSAAGTVMPSALAVFILMTSWKRVGCSTGKWAGWARDHSGLMPANLTTLVHFSASAATKAPNSAALRIIGMVPTSLSRALMSAVASPH